MKKRYCIIPQILLLFWFFLDMTGIYFRNTYLVTRSYKDDGIFFLIYFVYRYTLNYIINSKY